MYSHVHEYQCAYTCTHRVPDLSALIFRKINFRKHKYELDLILFKE